MIIQELNSLDDPLPSLEEETRIWGLFEYVESVSILSWAERANREMDIPLIFSSLSVIENTIITTISVDNVRYHCWEGGVSDNTSKTSQNVEEFINSNGLCKLPAEGRSTGRFLIVTYGLRASTLDQIDVYYSGLSMPEIVGLLEVSVDRFRQTLSEQTEEPVFENGELKDRSSVTLSQLLDGLTFHAPEPDLDINEAWALVQSENQEGDVTWCVAASQNVDCDYLIGALSARIHELRAWIIESYSDNELNPFIDSDESGEVQSDNVAIEEEPSSNIEDRRLKKVLVEMEDQFDLHEVTFVYLWVFGRNAEGALATNFIVAESEGATYFDESGYVELGLLLMERNRILSA